jgi:hypothetical protein
VTFRFVGIGESSLDRIIKENLTLPREMSLSSLFEGGRVDMTFMLPAGVTNATLELAKLRRDLRHHLGDYLYSADGSSLEEVVSQQFHRSSDTLVLVEIGTGGDVAAALNATASLKSVVTAAFVAPSEAAMTRLLDPDLGSTDVDSGPTHRLRQLLLRALEKTGASRGVGIGEPLAAKGGHAVWCVMGDSSSNWLERQIPWHQPDASSRSRLTTRVLDLIRRNN